MADPIFISGECLKSEFYNTFLNWFLTAGWVNKSSNPSPSLAANDGDVLYSTGEAGNLGLLFNVRPLPVAGTPASNISTSTNVVMSYRLQDTYEPNSTAGVNGIFGRPTLAWTPLSIYPVTTTAIPPDATVKYKYTANKDRVICVLDYAVSYTQYSTLFYIGTTAAEDTYCNASGSRNMFVGVSSNAVTAGNFQISNTTDARASWTAPYTIPVVPTTFPIDPTDKMQKLLNPYYLSGGTNDTTRGQLAGVYGVTPVNLSQQSILTVGTEKFGVIITQISGNNSFPTNYFAIRVE